MYMSPQKYRKSGFPKTLSVCNLSAWIGRFGHSLAQAGHTCCAVLLMQTWRDLNKGTSVDFFKCPVQLWKLPASSNWSFNFQSEELLEEFLWFLCHWVSTASAPGARRPWGCHKGHSLFSAFSPFLPVCCSRSTSCLFKHLLYHSQPPPCRNSQNPSTARRRKSKGR